MKINIELPRIIEKQRTVINEQSAIIDSLFLLLSQHISASEMGEELLEQIKKVAKKAEE